MQEMSRGVLGGMKRMGKRKDGRKNLQQPYLSIQITNKLDLVCEAQHYKYLAMMRRVIIGARNGPIDQFQPTPNSFKILICEHVSCILCMQL